MPRLFIAIKVKPGNDLLNSMMKIQQTLASDSINWVKPYNMHITLKFLGDTRQESIPPIISKLKTCAAAIESFGFTVKDFGYFGNLRFPRVLWMGVEQEKKNIENAYQLIQTEMDFLGYPAEKQEFRPHLTIGRIKNMHDTQKLRELEGEFSGVLLQQVWIDTFELYQSKLTPSGPVYSVVEKFNLNKPDTYE